MRIGLVQSRSKVSAKHTGLVKDITDTNCQTQNGSAQVRVFVPFTHRFILSFILQSPDHESTRKPVPNKPYGFCGR